MLRQPATDQEIRKWVHRHFGFWPEPAWIAHCKRLCSLPAEDVGLYQQPESNPCPSEKQAAVIKALRHFGMLPPEK
jgi:hypothetical protein